MAKDRNVICKNTNKAQECDG
ncbi:uncharacterized protein G2W53_012857 [Senna tora]|uniref:Uncharacterized protein n=1 Tax=Senna tora TaxID=362788 RepID=A0A834WSN0_9FABA|nr:uncharacterized protein G2W53_012857 [Senna tora]